MGTVEISIEEYKTLVECQIRINQLVKYLANEDSSYADRKIIDLIAGTAYPVHEEKNNDGKQNVDRF